MQSAKYYYYCYYYFPIYVIVMHHTVAIQSTTITVDDLIRNTFQNIQSNITNQHQYQQQQQQQSTTFVSNHASTPSNYYYDDAVHELFNEHVSDVIARNVLNFANSLANQLYGVDSLQSEIFSPLSVMSALSLLVLGAKGESYQQLITLMGLDNDVELQRNRTKYHREFALMLVDVQQQQQQQQHNTNMRALRKRRPTSWRHIASNKPTIVRPVINTHLQQPTNHYIKIANGIFIQTGYTLNANYKDIVTSLYNSELTQVDYLQYPQEAKDHINAWVNANTQGKIPNIINGPIDQSTNILLASVLYFKGFWETPFFPKATKLENFYTDGPVSRPFPVPMMATGGSFPFYEAKDYDCRIIGLPYKGNEITMYVIQPNNSTRHKLRQLQNALNADRINDMIEKMVLKTTVMVFPKMHFTRSLHMKNILRQLGLRDVFVRGVSDLSLIGNMKHYSSRNSNNNNNNNNNNNINDSPPLVHAEHLDRFNEPALIFRNAAAESNSSEKLHPNNHFVNKEMDALNGLEMERSKYNTEHYRSDLYVEDVVHKVDFEVDEQGTEAAAATLTYLHRSGTDVVFRGDAPFLILIRHDPTKLTLFYGIINKPEF